MIQSVNHRNRGEKGKRKRVQPPKREYLEDKDSGSLEGSKRSGGPAGFPRKYVRALDIVYFSPKEHPIWEYEKLRAQSCRGRSTNTKWLHRRTAPSADAGVPISSPASALEQCSASPATPVLSLSCADRGWSTDPFAQGILCRKHGED